MKDTLDELDLEPDDWFYTCEDCDEKHPVHHIISLFRENLEYSYYICRGNEMLYKINGRLFVE